MEQRIRRLRRSVCVAGLVAGTFLLVTFTTLAWLDVRAAAQQSETALDSAVRTIDNLAAAARSDASERLAVAGRLLNAELHDAGNGLPLTAAAAQQRVDSATYIVGVSATLLQRQSERFETVA